MLLLGLGLLILLVSAYFTIRYYINRNRFTRERFAFAALSMAMTSFMLTFNTFIGSPPWAPIASLINTTFGTTIQTQQANNSDKVLVLLLLIILYVFTFLIHRNWDGVISVNQFERDRKNGGQTQTFIAEGSYEFIRKITFHPPSPVYEKKEPKRQHIELQNSDDTLVWNEQAKTLIELTHPNFSISMDDWHDRFSCWTGKDKKTELPVVIFCPKISPNTSDVQELLTYIKSKYLKNNAVEIELYIVTIDKAGSISPKIAGTSITQYTEEYLLDNLVDFSDYIADVKKQVEEETLPDSSLTLADTYVQSYLKDSTQSNLDLTFEGYLEQWLEDPSRQQIALLGEYGQGKTTGSLMFTYNMLCSTENHTNRTPILIDLKSKSPSSLSPVELLGVWASKYNIIPKAMHKLLVAGKLCIIFEGFDEMQGVADHDARINHFTSLWKFSYPNSKIIITGRPNFFLDDDELKHSLGIQDAQGVGPSCKALYLRPFTSDQVHNSLRKCDTKVQEEILSLFEENSVFRDIASRPSLLYIISIIWNNAEMIEHRNANKLTSAFIISTFINNCCNRQTEKQFKHTPQHQNFMILNESELRYFMNGIAVYMVRKNGLNQISSKDLTRITEVLYEFIPDEVSKTNPMTEGTTQLALKERLKDTPTPVDIVNTNVRSYGLLVRDFSGNNIFKFPHKSFLEYLYAEYLASFLLKDNKQTHPAIRNAMNASGHPMIVPYSKKKPTPESIKFAGEIFGAQQIHPPSNNIEQFFTATFFSRHPYYLRFMRKVALHLVLTSEESKWDNLLGIGPVASSFANTKLYTFIVYNACVYITGDSQQVDSEIRLQYGDSVADILKNGWKSS
ncbi:NACHT domain-containing protein [Maridesulfovibrio frigidus]|uniref:NACHT domain-containing protein n=1 Tax=Maridesulfovibrio frigidus TaxID=340956 RepID=UPI0004E11962|nr:hypothetical protein [Maridesulfovibrio frigidus]